MPRSFLVLPAPTSRFRALVLAQMTDAPPRSTSSCASTSPCRPLAISVPVIPSSLFPPTLSIFVPTSLLIPRFSAVFYSHAEHPVSEYVVSCEKHVPSLPVSFDFCPPSSHHLLDSSSSRPPNWPSLNLKASNHHLDPRFNLVFVRQF
ncbi:hypothetical protein F5888DRAFT_1714549 [Russula emetica]|nr:hypothetical protein F5888DRAFT_1714486 [Russula emetica]KAF8494965.1 hypothetical protein F5888DRAFT_1714549 [Russula emetica]